MPDFTKDVKDLTTTDLLDAIYGEIQAITERGAPDNVVFHYFLPPVPFGPELTAFMDLGRRPEMIDNTDESGQPVFTVNDMMRAAVNFHILTDYIPALGSDPLVANTKDDTVDLNSLISSGMQVSKVYGSVLRNCRVVNNSLSEQDQARLDKLRALLYESPPPIGERGGAADDGEIDADVLIDELGGEDDIDLDALLSDEGADTGDFVVEPDSLLQPTRLMQLYRALEARYRQVEASVLERMSAISPNDPSAGRRRQALQQELRSAMRRWEVQGKKRQVEAVMAKIAVLSRGGMPQYLADLRQRFDDSKLNASVFATGDSVGLLTEEGHYTALRPNGILRAPSLMKVTLRSSELKSWSRMKKSSTSGSAKIPIYSLFGSGGGSKSTEQTERSFFSQEFEIAFEITQGVIDRDSWMDIHFIESPAYTLVDPADRKTPLDTLGNVVTLSDGKRPPTAGVMPAIPMTAYFVRNLVVRSKAMATMSDQEKSELSGKAGVSLFGFGASGKHSRSTAQSSFRTVDKFGEVTLDGSFMIGVGSRYTEEAPSPDFESHPNPEDWI